MFKFIKIKDGDTEFPRYFMGCFFSFVPKDRNIKEYMGENENEFKDEFVY